MAASPHSPRRCSRATSRLRGRAAKDGRSPVSCGAGLQATPSNEHEARTDPFLRQEVGTELQKGPRGARGCWVGPGDHSVVQGPAPSLREDRSSKPGGLPRDRGPQGRSDPPSCHRAKPGSSEHLGVAPAVCGPARGTAGVARAPGLATSVGCQRDPREDGQSPTGRGTLTPASQMQPQRQASTDPMVVPTRSPARPGRGPGRGRRDPPRRPALQSGPARRSDKFRKTSRVTRLVGWFF